MPQKLKILVRMLGAGLVIFAAIHFIIDVTSSMQTEQRSTPDGFVIDHRIEIPHTTFVIAIAGAALFALTFIRTRNST